MISKKIIIPVVTGLLFGQVMADSDRPFSVVNNLRIGYTDNLYRNTSSKTSAYVRDIVDISFRAALSARTDFMAKTRVELLNDSEDFEFYPNLYAMLSHSASPRWLLRLTDYHRSGEVSNGAGGVNTRENYFYNRLQGSANYVLNEKNRLEFSGSYGIKRHENTAGLLDFTTMEIGSSWSRELIPQRTRSTVSLSQRWVDYVDSTRSDSHDATEGYVGISHTINQQWQGNLDFGATHVRPKATANADSRLNPLARAGLVYTPSPRTRLNANFTRSYTESDDSGYAGQDVTEFRFGVQRDLTAKLMAKATARFAQTEYDQKDSNSPVPVDTTEDRMDVELSFTYEVNRINFIELSLKHSQEDRTSGGASTDWDENRIELGWRIDIK